LNRPQHSRVSGGIDARGKSRHHRDPLAGEGAGQLRSHPPAVGGGGAGTDDRHPWTALEGRQVPERKENGRGARVSDQIRGVAEAARQQDVHAETCVAIRHLVYIRTTGRRSEPTMGIYRVCSSRDGAPSDDRLEAVQQLHQAPRIHAG
jgi:hypothetical protein